MAHKLLTFFEKIGIDVNLYSVDRDYGGVYGESILKIDPKRFEINPETFLDYAKEDFLSFDERGCINALSNVKKSIECQSDIIHFSFGIPYSKLNFPTKMENLQKMGMSPSKIFNRMNQIRVNLEHFYKKPDINRVKDGIEIAELFLSVTSLSMTNFSKVFFISEDVDESSDDMTMMSATHIRVEFDEQNNRFELTPTIKQEKGAILQISVNDKEDFFELIKLSINIGKRRATPSVNKQLFKAFYSNLNSNLTIGSRVKK